MHRRSGSESTSRVKSSQRRIRAAQTIALPGSAAKLERSEKTLSDSIGRQLESAHRLLDSGSPALPERDCLDCGAHGAMKLQNRAGTHGGTVPLLYVCKDCGALLTIPPPVSPVP